MNADNYYAKIWLCCLPVAIQGISVYTISFQTFSDLTATQLRKEKK